MQTQIFFMQFPIEERIEIWLKKEDGSVVKDDYQIEEEVSFFKKLYSNLDVSRQKVIVECSKDKALGPEIFNFAFLPMCWLKMNYKSHHKWQKQEHLILQWKWQMRKICNHWRWQPVGIK